MIDGMKIERVTITGADDGVDPASMLAISKKYPFTVEWGILLSASHEGGPRFPSYDWTRGLKLMPELHLSGHLCGEWVRALCRGDNMFATERPDIADLFQRVQLNFHGEEHYFNKFLMTNCLQAWGRDEYIFQADGVNESIHTIMYEMKDADVPVAPLYDTSGGEGREPDDWPPAYGSPVGYAGGLHPERILTQLDKIEQAARDATIWIDVETHVRTDDKLDLDKVRQFLDRVKGSGWVTR
jgi:hypothetical protein